VSAHRRTSSRINSRPGDHDSRDEQAEFLSAAAAFLGPMRWDLARPLLQRRLGG
jgi:hypothetical protein